MVMVLPLHAFSPHLICYVAGCTCRGLKRLSRAPHLSALLLEGCEHVTEYGLEVLIRGGGIKVLVVHGCGGVDERWEHCRGCVGHCLAGRHTVCMMGVQRW